MCSYIFYFFFRTASPIDIQCDLAHWAESSEQRLAPKAIDSSCPVLEGPEEPIPQASLVLKATSDHREANGDGSCDDSAQAKAIRPVPGVRKNAAVLVRFTSISDRCGPVARDPNEDDEFAVVPSVSKATDDATECHPQLLFEKGSHRSMVHYPRSLLNSVRSLRAEVPERSRLFIRNQRFYCRPEHLLQSRLVSIASSPLLLESSWFSWSGINEKI